VARIASRALFVVALVGLAVFYYYFLGAGPTPSEKVEDLPWWRPMGWALRLEQAPLAPLQEIAAAVEQARHEGRWEPRGLIPLALFTLPPILLGALGFRLFRSALARVLLLATAVTLCAFAYYGWLSVETWQDYSWRWPITLFLTAVYLAVFALAPALVEDLRGRPAAVRALGLLAFAAPIYFMSTEITGTNPRMDFNLDPWPVITLYGFLLFGLVLGVVHLAAGAGVLARRRLAGSAGLVLGVAVAALLAAALRGVPFERTTALRLAVLVLPAAALVAWAGRAGERGAPPSAFLLAGVLMLGTVKAGQSQGEYFQAQARDAIAPAVIAALERYRADQEVYPLELSELVPAYLPGVPRPRVGWFEGAGEDFTYTDLGDSFLLEFSSVLWVQCAYSPAYEEETEEEGEQPGPATRDEAATPAAGAGGEQPERLGAAWSCERKPPRLW